MRKMWNVCSLAWMSWGLQIELNLTKICISWKKRKKRQIKSNHLWIFPECSSVKSISHVTPGIPFTGHTNAIPAPLSYLPGLLAPVSHFPVTSPHSHSQISQVLLLSSSAFPLVSLSLLFHSHLISVSWIRRISAQFYWHTRKINTSALYSVYQISTVHKIEPSSFSIPPSFSPLKAFACSGEIES